MKRFVLQYLPEVEFSIQMHESSFIDTVVGHDKVVDLTITFNTGYKFIERTILDLIDYHNDSIHRLFIERRDVPSSYYSYDHDETNEYYMQVKTNMIEQYPEHEMYCFVYDYGYATHYVLIFENEQLLENAKTIALLNGEKIIENY